MNRRLSLGALLVSMLVLFAAVPSPALAAPGDEKKNHNKPDGNDPDPEPEEYGPTTRGDDSCNDPGDGGRFDETCNQSKDDNDGSPADGKHGNGGNGKCAGCDGKADNQDPPGQSRNDHNNGYECDHNGGVGKGNPSHSRCLPDEDEPDRRRRPRPTPPPEEPPIVNPAEIPSAPCDKDMNPANGIQECVLGVRLEGRPPQPAPVPNPAVLPFTGNEPVGGYVLLALALMAAGGVLLRIRPSEKTEE